MDATEFRLCVLWEMDFPFEMFIPILCDFPFAQDQTSDFVAFNFIFIYSL